MELKICVAHNLYLESERVEWGAFMKLSAITLVIILIAGTAFAVSEVIKPEVYTWRYKITVEIETPEGIKSGSAVREVRARKNNRELMPQLPAVEYDVFGEAVVVDLDERGVLFALIDWDSYQEVFNAFPFETHSPIERLNYYRNLEIGQTALLETNHPRIVKFENIEDITSIKLVYRNKNYANGHVLINNFEDIFGLSVNLHGIKIQITDEELTYSTENKLLFFKNVEKAKSWLRSLRYGDPVMIDRSNFQRKVK